MSGKAVSPTTVNRASGRRLDNPCRDALLLLVRTSLTTLKQRVLTEIVRRSARAAATGHIQGSPWASSQCRAWTPVDDRTGAFGAKIKRCREAQAPRGQREATGAWCRPLAKSLSTAVQRQESRGT